MPCDCFKCAEHMGSKAITVPPKVRYQGSWSECSECRSKIAYFPFLDPGSVLYRPWTFEAFRMGWYQALWALQRFSEGTPKQTKCMVEQVQAVWARSNSSRSAPVDIFGKTSNHWIHSLCIIRFWGAPSFIPKVLQKKNETDRERKRERERR